jgi:CheY-like chemotaxis protein
MKKILLIERDSVHTADLVNSVKHYGYEITTAVSGEMALDIFTQDPNINVVIMNTHFGPGLNGTQTASRILKHREVPIIFWLEEMDMEIVKNIRQYIPRVYVLKKSEKQVLISFIQMVQ